MPLLAAPVLASIIGGGAAVAGGALANKGSSQQQQTSTPTFDPTFSPLQSQVLGLIQNRLGSSTDLSGYTGSGIANINKTYDATKQAQDNNLTARGLASSPVAATVDANREYARAGDIAGFRNSIPLLQRSLQGEDLNQATGILGLGRGISSTGSGSVSGGGGPAGAFQNLAGYLGYLQGKGIFKPGAGQSSTTPAFGDPIF